jgi:nuclear pore complex protein Nup155
VHLLSPFFVPSGVFKDSVEWCLVVTTPEEAILCALARAPAAFGPGSASPLRLVPTRFVIPSDWVAFLSVAGTPDGRVFLGGQDGKLYEMDYDQVVAEQQVDNHQPNQLHRELDEFYDGSKPCPPVLTEKVGTGVASVSVKRALSSVVFRSTSSAVSWGGPRKCRKLNHSSASMVSAFVPDFIRDATSAVFGVGGTNTGGGPIVQMVVDNERQVLYTLSSRGWISAVDIATPLTKPTDGTPTVRLAGVMDSVNTARQYLEAVSRGRMYPPTSSSGNSTTGIITFPGGGASAQAGVGGMDGARTILKLADATSDSRRNYQQQQQRRGGGGRQNDHLNNILAPVALHVVPRRESARLTLVAVTAGGLRYYISSLAPSVLSNGPSNHFGTNRLTDPLTPYSKLTFCHIRAPPPLSNSNASGGFNMGSSRGSGEGMVPQMAATLAQLSRVDASWYRLGVFVVALKTTGTSGGSNSNGHVDMGNVIVTASVDSVARVKETMDPTGTASTTTGTAMDKLLAPGGICEVLSLPMSTASVSSSTFMGSQGNGSLASDLPVLHGGRVWEMSVNLGTESTILSLALQSKTPTDAELSVGVVPAYFPKSKIQLSSPFDGGKSSPQQLTSGANGNGSGSTGSSRSTASMAITLLKNMVLARPLRHGIDIQRPRLEGGPGSNRQVGSQISTYRVSKREGTRGFSLSAGDEKTCRPKASPSLSSSAPSSSTRLSPWLLRPAIVPLNPLSIQHLMLPSRQMIALNAGGLHYFGMRTVLMSLADTILSSGVNVDNDPNVTEFFNSYGYKEGCAMCLLIAIGYGGNNSEDLKDRAKRAALRRALQPKVVPLPPNAANGGAAVPQSSDWNGMNDGDPLIPTGYKFEPSALCDALSLVLARLLRPIWHKPAVVVTEGPTVIRMMGSSTSRSRTTPAKVELLLDEATLEGVRHPLYSLLLLIRQVFSRAVRTIPGSKMNGDGGSESMEVDENNAAGQEAHFLTRLLEYNQHARAGTGGTYQLRPAEAEELAYLMEERNIHSFYRLLSRTVQLMSLLSHLRRAQSMPDLPEVEWGLLHGLTIAQLVLTRDGHERMESLLNSLIALSTDSVVAQATGFPPSAEASQFTNVLTEHCYHFFSPGSRFAYLGFRSSTDALACPPGTSRRKTRQEEAVKFLRRAALHWNSPPLITGRILRTKEREGYEDMASRAYQFDSPLAKAVSLLVELEEVSGVVEICLLTAANFASKAPGIMVEASDLMHPEYTSKDLFPWEKGLYHKRRTGSQSNGTSDRSSGTSAVGTTVTAKDALDTCYALIFSNVTRLLTLPDKFLGEKMVSVCAAATDNEFLHAFFAHLLESNHADTLLLIDSPALEKWLMQSSSNPDLLYKYYVTQGKYVEAGADAWKRARQTSEEVYIDNRITWLVRANDCFLMALEESTPSGHTHGVGWQQWESPGTTLVVHASQAELKQTQTQVAESLAVAKLQSRILNTVNSSQFSLTEEDRKKLELSLVEVSDLYNLYALPMNMNENCLFVLHTCRHNNEDYIGSHWRGIVCEEILPCSTRSEQVYNFLRNLIAEVGSEQNFFITLLSETATADDSQPLFESGVWMKKLESRVVSLGKELYGTGADYVFPTYFIVSLLEGEYYVTSCCLFTSKSLSRLYFRLMSNRVAKGLCLGCFEGCGARKPGMAISPSGSRGGALPYVVGSVRTHHRVGRSLADGRRRCQPSTGTFDECSSHARIVDHRCPVRHAWF